MFRFDNSYLNLPEKFYSKETPEFALHPEIVMLNYALFDELNIDIVDEEELKQILVGNKLHATSVPIAQAYAGHQFGHFTMLGDGRAILIGEHLTSDNRRFDIQLKGSGPTVYSRRGDGRATLKSMLREFLISEAMHHLGISSSRSLAIVKTGNDVYRETKHDGAVLTRVMKSHLRVGTFEFVRRFGSVDELRMLLDYTIERLYPHIKDDDKPIESFFLQVVQKQIDLVCHWMRVGFIHGVMNTDNTSISAETFDFGPCAFMNWYDPKKVFSSIDAAGRYAFGNQPSILKWNMARFLETLLPLIDSNEEKALHTAKKLLVMVDTYWNESYTLTMLRKLGLEEKTPDTVQLVNELFGLMEKHQMDYTNTFAGLTYTMGFPSSSFDHPEMKLWLERWEMLSVNKQIMAEHNPVFIPRNHLVEGALNTAVKGDLSDFLQVLEVLKKPYVYKEEYLKFTFPPEKEFERSYQTYCGT
jgi:uncharacterized protein YdiU (UPF0061 family)